jgi:hypothetical protein
MDRRIVLEADGVSVVARLLEDAAPNSTQRLWDVLPMDETLRHVRWGGSAAYVLAAAMKDPDFPFESRISFYDPNTISLKPQHGELAFSYGQAQARDPKGTGWATPLAVLEGDTTAFLTVLAGTQREGAKRLTIRRHES